MKSTTKIEEVIAGAREISSDFHIEQLTSGHINQTYLISNNKEKLILQNLNTKVFSNLDGITQNILLVSNHLKQKGYPHQILEPVAFNDGGYLWDSNWRLFTYLEDTQTFLKVQSSEQTYEAAKFLSLFHAHLLDVEVEHIQDSIPGFLDFEIRLEQYKNALKKATEIRLEHANDTIDFLKENQNILTDWLVLLPQIPTRIIHADPKISNFLFDKIDATKIVAVIDWDTILQGSILYDFGDMVRSYTNLKEEDNPEVGNNFSLENYKALEKGFVYHLDGKLTKLELDNLSLGARVVIYIQAMRFLTDYLNGDVYYATQYEDHNLDRTKSQINLLKELQSKLF